MSGSVARTAWVGTRKVSGGRGGGGPHQRLSRRTELVGVPLASAAREEGGRNSEVSEYARNVAGPDLHQGTDTHPLLAKLKISTTVLIYAS